MTENVTLQIQKSTGNPSAPVTTRDKHPFTGTLATIAQSHQAGLGLGIIGLLVGTLAASPLIAIVGLIGGIAVGTALDRNKCPTNPIGQAPQTIPERSPASASAPATVAARTTDFSAAADCGPGICDVDVPVVPGPIGCRKRAVQKLR